MIYMNFMAKVLKMLLLIEAKIQTSYFVIRLPNSRVIDPVIVMNL